MVKKNIVPGVLPFLVPLTMRDFLLIQPNMVLSHHLGKTRQGISNPFTDQPGPDSNLVFGKHL